MRCGGSAVAVAVDRVDSAAPPRRRSRHDHQLAARYSQGCKFALIAYCSSTPAFMVRAGSVHTRDAESSDASLPEARVTARAQRALAVDRGGGPAAPRQLGARPPREKCSSVVTCSSRSTMFKRGEWARQRSGGSGGAASTIVEFAEARMGDGRKGKPRNKRPLRVVFFPIIYMQMRALPPSSPLQSPGMRADAGRWVALVG